MDGFYLEVAVDCHLWNALSISKHADERVLAAIQNCCSVHCSNRLLPWHDSWTKCKRKQALVFQSWSMPICVIFDSGSRGLPRMSIRRHNWPFDSMLWFQSSSSWCEEQGWSCWRRLWQPHEPRNMPHEGSMWETFQRGIAYRRKAFATSFWQAMSVRGCSSRRCTFQHHNVV